MLFCLCCHAQVYDFSFMHDFQAFPLKLAKVLTNTSLLLRETQSYLNLHWNQWMKILFKIFVILPNFDAPPSSLMDLTASPEVKIMEGVGACSLVRSILGVKGHARVLGSGLGRSTSNQFLTHACTNQTTSWWLHNWSTFGAWMNHKQTWIHKTHHGPKSHHLPPYNTICAWPRNQHPNVNLSRDSQAGVPKFPKLGLPRLWGPVILCANL
jgi:hypothetical protein